MRFFVLKSGTSTKDAPGAPIRGSCRDRRRPVDSSLLQQRIGIWLRCCRSVITILRFIAFPARNISSSSRKGQLAGTAGVPPPEIRACDEISGALCCRPPGPLARRERRAYRVVCKERTTQPAGLRAAARRGAAAGGHLLRCRSSTMSPHRLRRGALHLPARRSRQSASLISSQALTKTTCFVFSEVQPAGRRRSRGGL